MVNLKGTNPISGNEIDTTSPGTWVSYVIGGAVVVGSIMAGKFAAETASDATNVGDTVSEAVMEMT